MMRNPPQLFTPAEMRFYAQVLDFLEIVHEQQARQPGETPAQANARDALLLNFTKVVNDCRAILLLSQSGFYIQAGILARSTIDACNLLMHIDAEGEGAELIKPWLEGRHVTHWALVESLKGVQLDIDSYRRLRKRLDDLVHANYEALKLYPLQTKGAALAGADALRNLAFWKSLLYFYLIACLLVVRLIAPALEEQAENHLEQLLLQIPVQIPQPDEI